MNFFNIPPAWLTIAGIVLFALALIKAYAIGFGYGSAKSQAEIAQFKVQIEQEYSKQLEKKISDLQKSKEYESALIEQLEVANNQIDNLIEQNKQEAETDPNKNECGLSTDSTKRINRIR